ncbi:MAG: CoA pyrophosphatase [Thermoguttaceae bacterium]
MNQKLPDRLAERLCGPLPTLVGTRFEPEPFPWRCTSPPPDVRPAAVLMLLYPHEDRWWLPLTLRPADLPAHGGQISLPGGAVEPGETDADAAVREFHEELGDDGQSIRLLGKLSPHYVDASNFLVVPWVGVVAARPDFTPNPTEVERLLEVPLSLLLDPAQLGVERRTYRGVGRNVPHLQFQSHKIWGATYMMLGQLLLLTESVGT